MILKRLLILMAFALPGLACEANHVLGGNITWECLGGDQYEITFTMYKDCYGTPGDPLTESFFFFPSGCASAAFSVDLDYVTAVEISDLCVTEFPNSSCSGGLAPGTMQVTYSGIVTLDPGCTWEAIWNNGSWNYFQNMDNFVAGNPVDAYITAEINTSAPCDDSIDITSSLADPAIEYACFGAPFCHQIDVTNPNAYTLTYTLVNTQTTGAVLGTSMNAPNYTIPAGVTLSATGNLCWTPNLSFGNYVFTVAINMMDGATYIGTMYENVVIVVRNCAPTVTTFNPAGVSSVGNETNQINATSVEACAGDTLQFSVTAVNADLFRAIDLTYTIAPAQPLFTFVQDGINPAVGTFTLITTNAMAGTCYTLTITATDDACPNPDTDVIVISACVRPNLELDILSDTVCVNEAVTLTASGLALPANYSWVAVGDVGSLPSNTGFSQTVTPTETTTYTVSAVGVVIPPLCSSTASATIYVSLSGLTLDPTAETCSNNNGSIDLTIDGDGSGDYCINWTPFGVACDPEDISGLNTGPYNVTVTDNVFGCVANGAANVGDVPAPTLSFTGGTTICAGGQTELCLDLTGGSAPFDITWGSAPPVVAPPDVDDPNGDWQDLPDPFCFFVSPAVTTTYTTATVTDASGCQANVALGQTVTVRPLVTGVILPEGPICNGACVSLNVDYAPGTAAGTYDVVYSIAGTNQIPVPAIDGGLLGNVCPTANTVYDIESISYQNAPLCPSSDAASTGITVVVNPLPTATVSGGVTVCNGACTNLTFTCTGTGPWIINYSINGIPAPLPLNAAMSPFVLNVCPTVTAIYCVTAVSDANCANPNNSLLNSCTTVTVLPAYTVASFTALDYELCPGDTTQLVINVNPDLGGLNQYSINITSSTGLYPSGGPTFNTQNSGPNFTLNVWPSVTTIYDITSLSPQGFPACAIDPNLQVTINVNGLINVVAGVPTCNTAVTPYEYQVVYTLSGGEAPYDELAGGNGGVFAPATTFTTDWIDSGTAAASWTFSDVNNCNSIVENTNNFTCPDVTDAGTMSNAALSLCGAVAAGGTYNNDSSLDANDDMMWVLCTDCINPLTTMVGIPGNPNAISATFTFGAPMTYGTTYYMVAVAGDGVAGGLVNTGLVAPYIDFSNCQPITWYETPTATLSTLDNTVCQGESVTLEINFTGTGPWTFVLDHPVAADETITTSNDPHNITVNVAGTYDLNSVSTGPAPLGNLCTGAVMGSVNVVINPLPTATLSGSAAICTGDQHCFSIAFTGTAPLEVTIDDPDGTNEVIPGIPAPSPYNLYCVSGAGSYFITSVEDANGCENNTDGVASIITVNPLPIVTWTANQVSYCDGADATITLDIVGANGPFAAVFITPEILFPNLALVDGDDWNVSTPGDYEIVSVEDALGCISALGDIITVTEIALPAANAGPDLEECVGNDVQIGTMSGQAGVSYSWLCAPNYIVGASNIEQPTLNSNTAGTCNCDLTVTTTIGGCQSTDDVSVTYFDYPVVTTTANPDSLCAGDCTTLTAAGATSYVWDPGDNFAGGPGSNVVVCPSATAEYFVTGTENHPLVSCASVDSITVYTGEPLDTLIDYTEEVCFNTCNGEIHITILGGFGPFIVTGDIDNINETDLCPGIYNFTITDAIGCSISGSLEIEERLPEFIDIINITPPVCEYDLGCIEVIDNTTSIFINGCGYDTLVFSDSWQFCGLEDCCYDIQTLFEVAPGVYCSTDSTVCIDNISPDITFNAVWTEDTFCYEDEACFAAVPAGGTGGLAVDWYEDIDMNILLSSDNPWCFDMIEDVSAYGVALDQLGCFSDTVLVEATLYPAITMDLQNGADSVSICEYDCIDLIVEVGGGNGNVSIEWFELPNDINILSVNDTVNVCPLFATCYMVIADDQCSVPLSDTVCVHVWDTPEVLFETDTLEGCWPLEVWFYDVSLPVNDSLVSSYWEFDDGNSSNEFDTTMNIYSTPTLYAEFFPSLTLTTLHGCVGSDTLTDPIIVHGYPEVDFTWEPQPVTVLVHDSIQMINLTEGAETYFWNFYGNSTSSQINPIHTFPAFDMGVYPVCLTATTEYGCADTLCQDILVEAVLGVFVPNTFTPDGDGINDIFLPVVTGYKGGTYHFWIFNRWGDPLFYTEDPEKAWTGGSDGGEYYVNQDTYVWRLEVEALFDGKIEVYEGHVTILR